MNKIDYLIDYLLNENKSIKVNENIKYDEQKKKMGLLGKAYISK